MCIWTHPHTTIYAHTHTQPSMHTPTHNHLCIHPHPHTTIYVCTHPHTTIYAHTHTQPSMHPPTPTHYHLHIHYTQGKTHWHARSPTCDICSQFSTHIPMISTLTEECTIHPVGQSATASLTHDQCCWSAPWPQTEPELHTYTRTHAHASWGNQKQQMP